MKTIIVSDLHNRVDWVEPVLSSIQYDRVIFLGDYFDDFNDTDEDITTVAEWLKLSLTQKKRVHLMGTHDMWYRFPYNRFLMASGNTPRKSRIINGIINKEEWNTLLLDWYEQGFLITHAGLHPSFVKDNSYCRFIKPAIEKALQDVGNGKINPLLDAGFARGGLQPFGGITWLDWYDEFEPVPYLNQIVGHTQLRYPEEKSIENSKNYCLDTKNNHIGILENNVVTWMKNPKVH